MADDQVLVTEFRAGSRRAGEALVDRYYATVLGFFRNKAPAAAHDLTQQTFAECFSGLGRLRDARKLRAFLFAIACNLLRAHYRSKRADGDRLDFSAVSAIDLAPTPSAIVARNQQHQDLIDGLRRIPIDHQLVLELHYWEDLSGQEIAEILDIPLGTVKTRIRRGRQLLAETLSRAPEQLDGHLAASAV